jgi:hypothetical protein
MYSLGTADIYNNLLILHADFSKEMIPYLCDLSNG